MSRRCEVPSSAMLSTSGGLSTDLMADATPHWQVRGQGVRHRVTMAIDPLAFKWLGIGLDNALILTTLERWTPQDNQRRSTP